jgi:hypothetical protein
MRSRDQGEEFPDDRIGRCRAGQAALEEVKRLVPVSALNGNRAQVEKDERIVRPVFQLAIEDLNVALQLPGPQLLVHVARMPNGQVRPSHWRVGPAECGQDLLVNPISPPNILAKREQSDMIDDRVAPGSIPARITCAAHHESGLVASPQSLKDSLELVPLNRLNHIIGIEPKRIIAGRMRKRLVSRCREVVDPFEVKHPCPELAGDLLGPVRAARIEDHDLIENPLD